MRTPSDRVRSSYSPTEIAGAIGVVIAVLVLLVSAVSYASGAQIAFFGLLSAFLVGVTCIGVVAGAREARLRRQAGS